MTRPTHHRTPQPPLRTPKEDSGNDHHAAQPTLRTEPDTTGTDPTGAEGTSVDPETFRRWRQITSAMPPMTPEEIAATGLILRRIDARLNPRPRPTH